jgi:hypothetical protein
MNPSLRFADNPRRVGTRQEDFVELHFVASSITIAK